MTHEELLAKINHQADVWDEPMAKALRAVVELHKSEKCGDCCVTCDGGYPCPTIQAIEKELR